MKRIQFILVTVLVTITMCSLSSCDSNMSRLKAEIARTKVNLPIDLGGGMSFQSLDLDESNREVVVGLNMGDMPLDASVMNESKDLMKESLECFMRMNDEFAEILKECSEADVSLTFKYMMNSGNVKLTMTPDDVKSVADMSEEDAYDKYFDVQVKLTRRMLPIQVDEATSYTDFEKEGNYLVYTYKVDESLVPVSLLEENESTLRQNLSEEFNSSQVMQSLISICKKSSTGLKYRYIGNATGQQIEETFETNEL